MRSRGRKVTVEEPGPDAPASEEGGARRVASLYPGGTELVAALGAVDRLVARSHWCDRPPAVRELPAVTRTRVSVPPEAPAGEIDGAYGEGDGGHGHGEKVPYEVLTRRLGRTRPDLLVTQEVCEICAVPKSLAADALDRLSPRPGLVSLDPSTLGEVLEGLEKLGRALGLGGRARSVRKRLESRVEEVLRARPRREPPSRVACIEWTDGLRSHGLWMPEFIGKLGATDVLGSPGRHGRPVQWSEVREAAPEVVIVSPCGRSMGQIESDMEDLVTRPGWNELPAVRAGQVYLMNGEISSRSGPRVVRALELTAAALYPDLYRRIDPSPSELKTFRPPTSTPGAEP